MKVVGEKIRKKERIWLKVGKKEITRETRTTKTKIKTMRKIGEIKGGKDE